MKVMIGIEERTQDRCYELESIVLSHELEE